MKNNKKEPTDMSAKENRRIASILSDAYEDIENHYNNLDPAEDDRVFYLYLKNGVIRYCPKDFLKNLSQNKENDKKQ